MSECVPLLLKTERKSTTIFRRSILQEEAAAVVREVAAFRLFSSLFLFLSSCQSACLLACLQSRRKRAAIKSTKAFTLTLLSLEEEEVKLSASTS